MAEINRENLKHLADLARLELTSKESVKLLKDLKKILGHFQELEAVDTNNVEPMTGGTMAKNVFRNDETDSDKKLQKLHETGKVVSAFPVSDKGYLKVPKVFGEDNNL